MSMKKLLNISERADQLYGKYRDYMDLYEKKSVKAMVKGVTDEDIYALGEQLEAFEGYVKFAEENGSRSDLGVLPNIAMDVIVASNAQSPIPLMASIQPMEEEQGTIYFKKVTSRTTKGNVTAGDTLVDPKNGRKLIPNTFASEEVYGEDTGAVGDGTAVTFTFNVQYFPVVKRAVAIYVDGTSVKLIDDGQGNLIGLGGQGVINYETGVVSVTFNEAPASGAKILADYSTNFEEMLEIPTIDTGFDSLSVRAKTYALRTDIGLTEIAA